MAHCVCGLPMTGLGRVAVLFAAIAAIGGGAFGVMRTHRGAVEYSPTVLIQVGVSDLDRSVHFYTEIMGFELESRNEELKWARVKPGIPGVTIGLGEREDVKGSGTVSLNFGVKHIDEARSTLEAKGVEFMGPTQLIPGVVVLADLKDPDGNLIRLAGHPNGYGEATGKSGK